jgi:3-hydroxyisobutyrate dehydrogenase
MLCSTLPPEYLNAVQDELIKSARKDIFLVDSPVSGGTILAAKGTLTIFVSSTDAALEWDRCIRQEFISQLVLDQPCSQV